MLDAGNTGLMKDCFDRCYYAALERVNSHPYAAMICVGSHAQNPLRQVERMPPVGAASKAPNTVSMSGILDVESVRFDQER